MKKTTSTLFVAPGVVISWFDFSQQPTFVITVLADLCCMLFTVLTGFVLLSEFVWYGHVNVVYVVICVLAFSEIFWSISWFY